MGEKTKIVREQEHFLLKREVDNEDSVSFFIGPMYYSLVRFVKNNSQYTLKKIQFYTDI